MNVEFAARSDVGQRRSENEDSVLACEAGGRYLFAVADGVGSLAGGAVASRTAVDTLQAGFARAAAANPDEDLLASILRANEQILAQRRGQDGPSASTLVALLVVPGWAHVAHVGDSRAYRLRSGQIERLTADHSLVSEQVRLGMITEEQAAESRHRHVITRSLGTVSQLDVEQAEPEPVLPGDVFLLSSDGLHGVVTDEELAIVLGDGGPVDEVVNTLIQLANDRGGPDNISAVVVRVIEAGP
jgi:protein phosphatase